MDPKTIENVFSEKRFDELTKYFHELVRRSGVDRTMRTMFDSINNPVLKMLGQELLPLARNIFECENLYSTKVTFAHYEGHQGVLGKHVDHNPNVRLIDVCIYEDVPWGIFIDGKEYIFPKNHGVAFYSGKQEHWRKDNPDKLRNKTGVLLAYFDEMPLDTYSPPVGEVPK